MSDKNLKVGDVLDLDIIEINNLGVGVAKKDGFVVFVKGGVSGDKVSAKVIKVTKSFAVARLERINSPSPYREDDDSACKEPAACGGCVWRNVSFEHELFMKQKYVSSAFLKVGIGEDKAKVLPVIHTDKIYRYRNKAQYPVASFASGIKAGFYATKTHNIIPISDCLIQNPDFAPIVKRVCDFANENKISAYDEKSGKGLLRHIYLRSADKTGEIMLCLVINGSSLPHANELVRLINEEFPRVVSVYLNINRENTNVVLGESYKLLFGKEFIEDILCGVRFRIAPEAFYQVNRDGAELLYNKAAELAVGNGESTDKPTVIDLYCGAGTIGLSLAKAAKRVVGIDIVEKSIECAKENARLNKIDNAEFFCTDAGEPENIKKCLDKCGVELSEAVVILDPPRKGSTPELIEFLAEQNVGKVVYISCNPDTLARDAECFLTYGYSLGDVQPVNMFPRTAHVETIVCLSRKISHEMKLHSSPFEKIKSGEKTIELRLYDEKRQKIKEGDIITFTNNSNGEKLKTTVKKIHRFDSFNELYENLPLLLCGYTTDDVGKAHPSDMEQYYSVEEQKECGVVGIELFPPKQITDESVGCLTRILDN